MSNNNPGGVIFLTLNYSLGVVIIHQFVNVAFKHRMMTSLNRILAVEDDTGVQRYLKELLIDNGYSVTISKVALLP